ncbi:hypothetical protein ABZ434_30800 [Streptomyces sp. NPDC005761]|uniref:hypothetical protein n=1 Tax=Streptomyces sp. NPDC005761 TaxID=3157066 RepID=UPI0033FDB72A
MGWYVLVERVKYGEWSLGDKIPVEGGEKEALARAEETARTRPPWGSSDSSPCGRLVFRTSPTSWLVELTESSWRKGDTSPTTYTEHLNIRVAELVHVQELVPAEPPKKGRFGR